MAKTVFLFSGQGCQYPGMGAELIGRYAEVKAIFDEASEILGFDLADKCTNGDAAELAKTVIAQPAIMAVSLSAFEAAKLNSIEATAVAGHSLGEYAAMTASGMLSRADAFRVIKARSEAMQKAAETAGGAMCAIIGKDLSCVEQVCSETDGYVVPVNYNSLAQTVIAGETEAVDKAAARFAEMGFRTAKLAVASAFHSKLMQPAADEFLAAIKDVQFAKPQVDFYSNITGAALTDFDNIPEKLAQHIVSPVRFTDELAAMQAAGYDRYVELGPGKVLSGLVKKTLKGVEIFNVEDNASLDKLIEAAK
ncbi:MAG: ACP S-malonyltransferase [Oscillospiraceae bacterium]|nr:ACP S-malonyltransferase [Oscillospiraceae bacterium]